MHGCAGDDVRLSRAGRWLIDAPNRRYSDEEFALILQRASKLQDRADGVARSRGDSGGAPESSGLSLQAVREIAEEVGLETRFIDQAAASLLRDPPGKGPGLLGGAVTYRVQDTFARTLTRAQQVELLDVVRGALRHQGEIRDVMGAAEWSSVGLVSRTTVTVHSHDDSVSIRVFTDLTGVALAIWIAPILFSFVIGAIIIQSPVLLPVIVAFGVGVARTIWSATARFFRRRTERLREQIALYLSD